MVLGYLFYDICFYCSVREINSKYCLFLAIFIGNVIGDKICNHRIFTVIEYYCRLTLEEALHDPRTLVVEKSEVMAIVASECGIDVT